MERHLSNATTGNTFPVTENRKDNVSASASYLIKKILELCIRRGHFIGMLQYFVSLMKETPKSIIFNSRQAGFAE